MYKVSTLLLIVFALCAGSANAGAANAGAANAGAANAGAAGLTLAQAVEQAIRANPGVESKLLMLESARMNTRVAQSHFWPRLSLVGNLGRVKNDREVQTYNNDNLSSDHWSGGLRLSLSLFEGFAHLNQVQKARLSVDMEEARHRLARLELGANVQLQFLDLLKSRENLKSALEAVARLETQLKAAEAFVRVEMAPYVNVLQNRTELSRAQQEVIRVRNSIRSAEVQLNRFLGFGPDQVVSYAGSLTDFPLDPSLLPCEEEALKLAERQRPDLVIARKSVELARKDVHIAAAHFLPKVEATVDRMRTGKDYEDSRYQSYTRDYWSAGVQLSWELFSGGQTVFSTQAEHKRAEALARDYEDTVSGARTEVIRSLLDIAAARELVDTARTGVLSARESYDMANKRYMTNSGTITELLDAQHRLTQAENDASQALAEYHGARVRFFYYIGQENPALE